MHGLIFETSVWLLAGSTRLISIVPLFLASRKTQVLQRKLCKPKPASFFFKKYLKCKQNANESLSTTQLLFTCQHIFSTEIVSQNRQCSTTTSCNCMWEFTMLLYGVLFDSNRSTKQKLRHKYIRAKQSYNGDIQLRKA